MLKNWIDKEIIFPKDINFSIQGTETTDFAIRNSDYKIVIYVDSTGCTSCKLHLSKWKEYINHLDSVQPGRVQFLFLFFPKNGRDIYHTLRMERFSHPIHIDTLGLLDRLNHFPTDSRFQTFLLNKENRVVAIGSPIHNSLIKDMYSAILEGNNPENEINNQLKTTVKLSTFHLNFGDFFWGEMQEREILLTNTGTVPLVINEVSTSCGCTIVKYNRQPIQSGKSIPIRIFYQAEHSGHFNKTITLYCNAEAAPFHLEISGNAE